MKISFITDEVTQSFDEAVRFARQNGLAGLELRSVEDTAIDMLPAETLRAWRRRLDAEGLTVCGLAGSFYKCALEPDAVEADGCHLPAPLLQLAYRHIGPQRLVLVTDAMRGAGQTQGESILGSLENGQRVILEDGVAKMPDRTAFAGSICTADRLVRTMVTLAGASLPDAVRMITETPARVLGLSDFYGRVEAGRAADLAVFDHTVRIAMVFKDGAVCFENREEAFQ